MSNKPEKVKNMTVQYRIAHFLFAWLVRLVFLVRTVGKKNEPNKSKNFIVCSNHISALDPIIIGAALRKHQPCYMAKKELFDVPVLKWIIKLLGAFPVNREGGNTGTVFRTIKMIKDGSTVGMFPQGTRHPAKDPRATKVRSGVGMIATKAKADILPVYLKVKGNKQGFLKPVKVIIGEPISFEELNYDPEAAAAGKNEYQRISEMIFDRICSLGEEESGRSNKK